MNTSTSKLNISGIMNEYRVDYQTYESFINTKTEDEDQGPPSNFLNDKIYDKIVRKVIRLNSSAKKPPIAKIEYPPVIAEQQGSIASKKLKSQEEN